MADMANNLTGYIVLVTTLGIGCAGKGRFQRLAWPMIADILR
jgi:hypothetical protein